MEKFKKVLMVIDYQVDFSTGKLIVPGADKIYENIQNKINDKSYDLIIYTFDTHNKDIYKSSDEGKLFPIHCEFGTKGWELYNIEPRNKEAFDNLKKHLYDSEYIFLEKEEVFFPKDKFSIFEGNNFYKNFVLENIDKNAIIDYTGVAEDVCVMQNAVGMHELGFKVNILKDCVAGLKGINPDYEKNINILNSITSR